MSKYLVFKKESYGNQYDKHEFETLEEIYEKFESSLKDVIITREVKTKIVEIKEEEK